MNQAGLVGTTNVRDGAILFGLLRIAYYQASVPSHVVTKATTADLPPRAAELVAAQFDTVAAVAEECDGPVATGVMPTGG
jgi:hypothetical protein